MSKMIVLIRKDILEQWRTKKILIIGVIFLFVAVASPILAKITPELLKSLSVPGLTINLAPPTYRDGLDQFIKNISQIALLVLVFVVAGTVSDEKSKKTLEIVMTKPISREKFMLSKFISSFSVISICFIAASTIFYAYSVSLFSSFNFANFSILVLSVLIYMLMIMSITILASTLVKNAIMAGGIGFVSFILFGSVFGLFEGIRKYSPNLIFSDYQAVVAGGWSNDLIYPTALAVGVIIISVISAILIFKRQEIDR